MNKPIELLAPAGNKDAFLAAIVAGADAIYFGLEEFNARKRAENIKIADLPLLCAAAHVHNCMCYMALNILFFDDEFEQIYSLVDQAVNAGIDAIIVQDIGAIHFLEENFPNLPVHVSTQVTVHNISQIDFLAQFKNVTQVNLSRELSLVDIKLITAKLAEYNLKSEIFVHGSYCISYSGQCYMSGILYGEAGNRGACVQPCRRAYTADYSESEGSETEFKPFNLKDNSAFNLAAELAKTGADSFKIEGRIKSAEYVWAVVSAWRQKIDEIAGNGSSSYKPVNLKSAKTLLDGCFNRGFTDDYLQGHASSDMFASQNGKADEKDKSVFSVGTVISYTSDTKQLVLREHENSRNMQGLEKGTKITIRNTDASFVCSGEITKVVSKPGLKTGNATYELHLTSKPDAKNPLRISRGQLVTAQPVLIAADTLKQLCADVAASGNRALNDKGSNGGSSLSIVVSGVTGEKLVAQFDAG
ncbi:MAG: U32 family peptidase, partial [Selenomonadaceae bacterium]